MPPRRTRTRQVPQVPPLQLCGRLRCWRRAAVSTGSSGRASNSRSAGRIRTFIRQLWAKEGPGIARCRGPGTSRNLFRDRQEVVVVDVLRDLESLRPCRLVGKAEVDAEVDSGTHHLRGYGREARVLARLLDRGRPPITLLAPEV